MKDRYLLFPVLSIRLFKLVSNLAMALCLSACAATRADSPSEPEDITPITRAIDWQRAIQDATTSHGRIAASARDDNLVVPLLLPAQTISVGGISSRMIAFKRPQVVLDRKGYAAVVRGDKLTVLVDATHQMIVTDEAGNSRVPRDFDGSWRPVESGGQLTVGRYGALYALQFVCPANAGPCISEQSAREIVQALQVHTSVPR